MDSRTLKQENKAYRCTMGASENNRHLGFWPAFMDPDSGQVELSRHKSGELAPFHVISWLPREWADEVEANGEISRLKPGIVTGFVRDGVFYTRDEAAAYGKSKKNKSANSSRRTQ